MADAAEVMGMPTGNAVPEMQMATLPAAEPQRPTTFRNILSVGLISLGAGLTGHPEAAAQLIGQRRNQQFNQRMALNEDARQQQQLELQQQQGQRAQEMQPLAIQGKQEENGLTHAQTALATVQKMKINKDLSYYDQEKQMEFSTKWAEITAKYQQAGLRAVAEVDNNPEALAKFAEQHHADGKRFTDVIPMPSPNAGKVLLFANDPSVMLDKDAAASISATVQAITGDKKFKLAPGIPVASADKIITGKISQYSDAVTASIRANADKSSAQSFQSYKFESGRLDNAQKPVNETLSRLSRLQDTLRQGTPQADALVAPELLTVMAGGQGSGLRMNEAEIARIVGGRSKWQDLQAAVNKWSVDPSQANSITSEQRAEIRALTDAVQAKVLKKQQVLDTAREKLNNSDNPHEHRKISTEALNGLSAVDQGNEGQPKVGDTKTFPNGKVGKWDGQGWVQQ